MTIEFELEEPNPTMESPRNLDLPMIPSHSLDGTALTIPTTGMFEDIPDEPPRLIAPEPELPQDFEVSPLNIYDSDLPEVSEPLQKPKEPTVDELVERMNGVEEAKCEALVEPKSINKAEEHLISSDTYEPLPRFTAPFRMPIVDHEDNEEIPLMQAVEPDVDDSRLEDLDNEEGDLHFIDLGNFEESQSDDDISLHQTGLIN